jgi:hypothetical protein
MLAYHVAPLMMENYKQLKETDISIGWHSAGKIIGEDCPYSTRQFYHKPPIDETSLLNDVYGPAQA